MKYIILDIDRTLADSPIHSNLDEFNKQSHKTFPAKYDVIHKVADLLSDRSNVYVDRIIYLTSRSQSLYFPTYSWIDKNCITLDRRSFLVMRPEGNIKHPADLKLETIKFLGIEPKDVVLWLDDDADVLQVVRYEGYNAIHPDHYMGGVK